MTALLRSAAVLGLFAAALAASADTFTESVQFGPGPTDFNAATGTTAGPGGNQLYLFDANGGTLNSITFSYSYSLTSTVTVTNTSATASNGSAYTQSAPRFSANVAGVTSALNGAVNTYVDPIDGNSVTFGSSTLSPIAADVRGTANNYSLAAGGSTSFASNGSFTRSNFTVTDASILAAFSRPGGGTFTPLFTTLTGLVLTNSGGNTIATQTTTAQGNLVISFNYGPTQTTPEPSALAALGLGAVALVKRRRK